MLEAGVLNSVIAAGAAAIVSLIVGGIVGVWFAHRKFNRHYEEVRGEVMRMRRVAEEKLAGDDPDLNALLCKLNDAVNRTYKAVEGLEDEGRIIRRKSEGAQEVIASSRYIGRMIDEFAGDEPEPIEPARPRKLVEAEASDSTSEATPEE